MLASADVVRTTEGRIDTPQHARREELAGVRERGMLTWGLPRNLGDLVVSVRGRRKGHPVEEPRPGDGALTVPGANVERTRGTAKRRKRSAAGGAIRSRSTP
jgi:hypothetical protein